jgi:thiol:disulfide interchange protein DsbD
VKTDAGSDDGEQVETDPQEGDNASSEADSTLETSTKTYDDPSDKKVEKAEDDSSDVSKMSVWTIFLLSFGSGLLALLTPCVFPMIPMTVSFFTKQSKTRAQGIRNATIYGSSIVIIYVLLGILVMLTGSAGLLNEMSTNPWFNIVFFVLLIIFAVSFMGAFEIRMPNSWINKADKNADKGGLIGIFFMALVLALVSFSCTGPIVGTLLVEAARTGGTTPIVGMFGFSLALALPFTLFAAFPGWMNSLPSSGGWLNTVKVVLGFLELALAFKFLSNADMAWQMHWLEREVFIAIWIGVFLVLGLYLLGFIMLPHDSKVERLSVGRAILGIFTIVFVIYMIPGMWGAPLKIINAFPPPMHYSESPFGVGKSGGGEGAAEHGPEGTHLGPQNLWVFHDLDEAKAYAKEVGKPLFIDFTGHNCVNCRKMEQSVWGEPGVIEKLRNDVVVVSLYVDEDVELPKDQQGEVMVEGRKMKIRTVGDKWRIKQIEMYKITAQPYYRMLGPNGEDLSNGPASFETHGNKAKFESWLTKGIQLYSEAK